jgi:hypothetical protein
MEMNFADPFPPSQLNELTASAIAQHEGPKARRHEDNN